jgi:hypothetical protein
VRASRFASSNYGAKVAVVELPFGFISSETVGGAGGTCVLTMTKTVHELCMCPQKCWKRLVVCLGSLCSQSRQDSIHLNSTTIRLDRMR